jgi:TolB-like protein
LSYLHPTADFTYVKRVAIAPFVNLTNDKFAGGKVRNVVATEVLRCGVFDVVEFGEVVKVLREEGMKDDGQISRHIAARAGKRLNIQAIFMGSVLEYGLTRVGGSSVPEVSISMKLVDTNSYTILWEATHNRKGTNVLNQLFGVRRWTPEDLCKKVVIEMLGTLFG